MKTEKSWQVNLKNNLRLSTHAFIFGRVIYKYDRKNVVFYFIFSLSQCVGTYVIAARFFLKIQGKNNNTR